MPDVTPGHPTLNPGETKKIALTSNGGAVLTNPRGVGGGGGGGGAGSLLASFEYVVTGGEAGFGTPDITIPIPPQAGSYQAVASDGGRIDGAQALYTAPDSGYAVASIVVHGPTAAIGDKINVLLVSL